MSRGPGKLQRALWELILEHGKPITFAEIRVGLLQEMGDDYRLRPSVVRSLRRALHRMAEDGELMAIDDGGRAEPYRYFIHPLIIGMMGKTPKTDALYQALKADPGANNAANECLAAETSARRSMALGSYSFMTRRADGLDARHYPCRSMPHPHDLVHQLQRFRARFKPWIIPDRQPRFARPRACRILSRLPFKY